MGFLVSQVDIPYSHTGQWDHGVARPPADKALSEQMEVFAP